LYFGIPQSRERALILCKRNDLGELPVLPPLSKKNIRKTSLTTILEENTDSMYSINNNKRMKTAEQVWNSFLTILKDNGIAVPKFPLWTDWWDSDGNHTSITNINESLSSTENALLIKKRQHEFYKKYKNWIDKNRLFYTTHHYLLSPWLSKSRSFPEWIGAVRKMEWQTGTLDHLTMNQVLWSARGSGIRVRNLDYTPTLVAMSSMIPVVGPYSRYLTPRECARLQSFPDDYIIHPNHKVAYKQFGNAVNVVMIQRCANFLINNHPLF